MILGLLAAAAAATVPAMPPDWKPAMVIRQPTAEEIHAVWPVEAKARGLGGKAAVACTVNVHGLTEGCHVQSESPSGMGFGGATLLLAPAYIFRPATLATGPVASPTLIRANFVWAGTPGEGEPPSGTFTMINRPIWATAPGFAALGSAYPKAGDGGVGVVVLRCRVMKTGRLRACELIREEPEAKGFGAAAKGLTPAFQLAVDPDFTALKGLAMVTLTIRLIDPASEDFTQRRIASPVWTAGPDAGRAQKLFPATAAAQGLKTGLGVARCVVAADGGLVDCASRPATPEGVGFSEAAVDVARVMKMSPWTSGGGPVDGAIVNLPIRFNLADGAAKSP